MKKDILVAIFILSVSSSAFASEDVSAKLLASIHLQHSLSKIDNSCNNRDRFSNFGVNLEFHPKNQKLSKNSNYSYGVSLEPIVWEKADALLFSGHINYHYRLKDRVELNTQLHLGLGRLDGEYSGSDRGMIYGSTIKLRYYTKANKKGIYIEGGWRYMQLGLKAQRESRLNSGYLLKEEWMKLDRAQGPLIGIGFGW